MINKLAKQAGKKLKATHSVLVTAESCTGGWVAQAVTSIAGSSVWFERGYVTYSDAAKREDLGVSAQALRRHGAVSEQVAREMALGALRRGGGTVAVAVTGIAGPGGGSPAKPVGTVCFAWARKGRIRTETRRFRGNRRSVREKSVRRALAGVLQALDSA